MVSTLQITLCNNQPTPQWLGRSASCEETNLLGFPTTLVSTSKTTSLSTSSVLRPQAPSGRVPEKPTSTRNLAPTPYSPSASTRSASWSPVRLKTKPLPDFLKRLNPEPGSGSSSGADQVKGPWARVTSSQGVGRPGLATSTGDGHVGHVSRSIATRWSPAANSDSPKAERSPRAPRRVLGVTVSSAVVSATSQEPPPSTQEGPPATPTQPEWRRLSGGSPSSIRKAVSTTTTNDPPARRITESSGALQEGKPAGVVQTTVPSVQDSQAPASDQPAKAQPDDRRPSLGDSSKQSPIVPKKKLLGDTAWLAGASGSATMPSLRTSSAPWQQRPNRLSSSSLQCFEDVSFPCLDSPEQLCFCFPGNRAPSVL